MKTNIKLAENNVNRIQSTLDIVQERAKVRTITPAHIFKACELAERKLNIPKKCMNGIEIRVDVNAEKYASAYKYTPYATIFKAVYKNNGWTATEISRGVAENNENGIIFKLTDTAKQAILNNYKSCKAW